MCYLEIVFGVYRARRLLISGAKVGRIANKKPLYRGYNRGYIGAIFVENQRVISISEYLIYFI